MQSLTFDIDIDNLCDPPPPRKQKPTWQLLSWGLLFAHKYATSGYKVDQTFFDNSSSHVYNMLAIRLDACFKFLHVVKNYVRHDNEIWLALQYDGRVVSLLMIFFDWFNPTTNACIK